MAGWKRRWRGGSAAVRGQSGVSGWKRGCPKGIERVGLEAGVNGSIGRTRQAQSDTFLSFALAPWPGRFTGNLLRVRKRPPPSHATAGPTQGSRVGTRSVRTGTSRGCSAVGATWWVGEDRNRRLNAAGQVFPDSQQLPRAPSGPPPSPVPVRPPGRCRAGTPALHLPGGRDAKHPCVARCSSSPSRPTSASRVLARPTSAPTSLRSPTRRTHWDHGSRSPTTACDPTPPQPSSAHR